MPRIRRLNSIREFIRLLVLDCKNKRYRRQAIWVAGAARARSIPAAGCDERATKPAAQRANGYIACFCNHALDLAEQPWPPGVKKIEKLGRLPHSYRRLPHSLYD